MKEEVKRIIIQLQQGDRTRDRDELSRQDVEGIVRNILGTELNSLRLSMSEENNQNIAEQVKYVHQDKLILKIWIELSLKSVIVL